MDEQLPRPIAPLLQELVDLAGSDLHLKVGGPPRIRIDGLLRPIEGEPLRAVDTEAMACSVFSESARLQFAASNEADFAYSIAGVGRFRVNVFRSRGSVGLVVRRVSVGAQPLSELGLPAAVESLAGQTRGLILVTGPTGSGKTTTLAGMIDFINSSRDVHILTIEDPIEVLHIDKRGMVNQREIRTDTADFAAALRSAMRQDPDVILVGEMRDTETVRAAIQAAETGHLVLSTLHTADATETINRILDLFPTHEQQQVRWSLAATVRGILCQRLVPAADGHGRVVAMEICINTGRVAEAISDQTKTATIAELIRDGSYYQMQSFDQHLIDLFRDGRIGLAAVTAAASNPHDVGVALRRLGLAT